MVLKLTFTLFMLSMSQKIFKEMFRWIQKPLQVLCYAIVGSRGQTEMIYVSTIDHPTHIECSRKRYTQSIFHTPNKHYTGLYRTYFIHDINTIRTLLAYWDVLCKYTTMSYIEKMVLLCKYIWINLA